ncbi:MAG: hypothetical protein JO247_03250, partial [Chloroflexi bacterium]|nr:hypothetical protein [Chloroflexota bacterium]
NILRNHKDRVMGGFAYVWNTSGPEAVDLDFGLTDDNGVPVDGTLAALATKYKADDLEDKSSS